MFHVGGRRSWLGITALIVALGAVEIAGAAFLAHRFLPAAAAWLIDAVGVLLLVLVGLATASATWRTHQVDAERARFVLGFLAGITVGRVDIAQVEALRPLAAHEADHVGPIFDGDGALILTAATGVPRVRLHLREPRHGRRLWQRREVTCVCVSDGTGGLAEALA